MPSVEKYIAIATVVLLAGAILLAWVASNFFDRRRTAALALVAQQLGFAYEHDGIPFPAAPEIPLLTTGRERKFSHLLHGLTAGMEASIFDYNYTTGGGKSSETHTQTVAAYRLPVCVATFWLHHPTWQDKVGIWFGGQNIGFDDDPEFSKRYRLQGHDESALRQLFAPAVRSYLESLPERGWHIESGGWWILVYEYESQVAPEAISDFLRDTSTLVAGFAALLKSLDSSTHHSFGKS